MLCQAELDELKSKIQTLETAKNNTETTIHNLLKTVEELQAEKNRTKGNFCHIIKRHYTW